MLKVTDLSVEGKNRAALLRQISFALKPGECIGLTGASGSGKTTLIKAIMGILDKTCHITSGEITLENVSLTVQPQAMRRELCGTTLGFIPQNPMTAFNKYIMVGKQMDETFRLRLRLSRSEARLLSESTLKQVNLPDTKRILSAYPDQLSGGMLQRVTIAILWGLRPRYILADEPTSALDETNRDHLLNLLKDYPEKAGILFLSHDVIALRRLCSKIMVMEKGRLIEKGRTEKIFSHPSADWTKRFVAYTSDQERGDWEWAAS